MCTEISMGVHSLIQTRWKKKQMIKNKGLVIKICYIHVTKHDAVIKNHVEMKIIVPIL